MYLHLGQKLVNGSKQTNKVNVVIKFVRMHQLNTILMNNVIHGFRDASP